MSNFDFHTSIPMKISAFYAKKKKMPKCKKSLHNYGCALILAVIALNTVLICSGCSKNKTPDASSFDGTYYIDDYTAYEFDGKGKGAMCLGEKTRYLFDYFVKDNTVFFDFEEMRINDTTYIFTLDGDAITITESGGANSYTMTKKQM